MSEHWTVIEIAGNPKMYAAYCADLRKSGKPFAEKRRAARDARRRNQTLSRRAAKIERTRARQQAKRLAEQSERSRRLPFIKAIKAADFQAIGVFADWLQEHGSGKDAQLGVRLADIFQHVANPMRFTDPRALPETALPHVAHGIVWYCQDALAEIGEIPKRSSATGILPARTTGRQMSMLLRLEKRARVVARKVIRAAQQAKRLHEQEPTDKVPS